MMLGALGSVFRVLQSQDLHVSAAVEEILKGRRPSPPTMPIDGLPQLQIRSATRRLSVTKRQRTISA
jgi:hypothetical protein